jgi:hypothetical protein
MFCKAFLAEGMQAGQLAGRPERAVTDHTTQDIPGIVFGEFSGHVEKIAVDVQKEITR